MVFQVSYLDELPICARDISTETRRNPLLSKVLGLTLSGWPNYFTVEHLKPLFVSQQTRAVSCGAQE